VWCINVLILRDGSGKLFSDFVVIDGSLSVSNEIDVFLINLIEFLIKFYNIVWFRKG